MGIYGLVEDLSTSKQAWRWIKMLLSLLITLEHLIWGSVWNSYKIATWVLQ